MEMENEYKNNLKTLLKNFLKSYGMAFFLATLAFYFKEMFVGQAQVGLMILVLFSLFSFELMNFKGLIKSHKIWYFTLSSFIFFLNLCLLLGMINKIDNPPIALLSSTIMNIVINYLIMIKINIKS